jgi:predicted AlkP superfamily phosphohydrolase/phosphomutase
MSLPSPPLLAYIGPGAGFAFLGSFLSLLAGFALALAGLLSWPFRLLYNTLTGRRGYRNARIQKLIFLGLDGLDPVLTERYMAEGKLPHLTRLRDQGGFHRLRTTFPPLSPVAWSTFATGVNPARHNMFDFLNRNLRSYLPELSSTRVHPPRRVLRLGRYRIPLSRPQVEMRRKSRTFWHILGRHGIASTILRVPITFPPENFHGRLLSAMCTPDLLGTQGTYALFTTRPVRTANTHPLAPRDGIFHGQFTGPENQMDSRGGPLNLAFTLQPSGPTTATLRIAGTTHELTLNDYSPWVTLTFRASLGATVTGIVRLLLTELAPHLSLYSTPININPEDPALPISHPTYYATYLARLLGTYSTLGMAEDTWALNEHAISSDAFLQQVWLTYAEREAMFLSALERCRRGVVACVFDTTDRVQHMFFAQKDGNGPHARVIEELYMRADTLVGKTLAHIDANTVLIVLSDHGFTSFERGVDLNAWLLENGYLALLPDAIGEAQYLNAVDWSRTRAYTFGLAGIYLNQRGREAQGIVDPGPEASALQHELAAKLGGLRDPARDRLAIRAAWPSASLYTGPYLDAAPDLIVGYAEGYRASWDAAIGRITDSVFTDNQKAWSGDHCVDPHLVPGVLFCNRPIAAADPGIEDMARTALDLFGIAAPPHMEGKSLFPHPKAAA